MTSCPSELRFIPLPGTKAQHAKALKVLQVDRLACACMMLINCITHVPCSESPAETSKHVVGACQVNTTRRQLGMRVFGFDTPKPVQTFAQCRFDALTMAAIKKAG